MAKTKQQKARPKKQPHVKRQGKEGDMAEFRAQLDALGLKIVQVTADGNCLFRAMADQLEGNEDEYAKYRAIVVQHIVKNREMFEPFIEDDVPFDQYCSSMEKDGTWAGHMELQAASLVTRCNICIHRNMSPRLYIRNFEQASARMVHLSYHDGEHYNSVRLKEDSCDGPAREVVIKADADLSGTSDRVKATASNSKRGAGVHYSNGGAIKLVMAGSGCENAEKVEEVLRQVDGNIDAAIEYLIAEQGTAEEGTAELSKEDTSQSCDAEISNENGNTEQLKEEMVRNTGEQESCNSHSKTRIPTANCSRPDDKKIPRNKVCPCGSKKKYKACCGTAAGRSSAKLIVSQEIDYKKGRKERKNCKRGGPTKLITSTEHDVPPDVGALCI